MLDCGPSSVVGIQTGYGLHGLGIESLWGARFSAPVQTGPGAHPASCTMVTGSFPGIKSGRGVRLTRQTLLVPWSRKCSAIPLLLWAVRPVQSLHKGVLKIDMLDFKMSDLRNKMSYTHISPVCQYSDVIYCKAIFVQGYRM